MYFFRADGKSRKIPITSIVLVWQQFPETQLKILALKLSACIDAKGGKWWVSVCFFINPHFYMWLFTTGNDVYSVSSPNPRKKHWENNLKFYWVDILELFITLHDLHQRMVVVNAQIFFFFLSTWRALHLCP